MAGMHSWLGTVTSIVYFLNFLIGLMTAVFRKLETFEFRLVHQLIGTYAFLLTVSTIISGITLYQGKEKLVYQ
jgi:integral membrane sensor domain MASE1